MVKKEEEEEHQRGETNQKLNQIRMDEDKLEE